MNQRSHALTRQGRALSWSVGLFITAALIVATFAPGAGQSPLESEGWAVPRTQDGHPDLQGVWANNNATPLDGPVRSI
jgi:hypothetical protein